MILKERSGACRETTARLWMLDSNAREAKERLDQKLRGQREPVVNSRWVHFSARCFISVVLLLLIIDDIYCSEAAFPLVV
jgi:hypothetical protein